MSSARHKPKAPAADDRADGLQVGTRVRYARMLKGVLARELAERVGCTESMISKIENGRVVPSLPMLQKVVLALEIDMATFFGLAPQTARFVLRKGERPITRTDAIRGGTGIHYERLVPFGSGHLLEANVHVIAPGGEKQDDITHQGEALGYVIEGQLDFTIDGTTYRLEAGDSFFYKAHLTTHYRNPGPSETRLVWVNTPQIH
jgi:transcriptional regulator with XRE-family HTH domain